MLRTVRHACMGKDAMLFTGLARTTNRVRSMDFSTSPVDAPLDCLQLHELPFQHFQPVFGDLGRGPLHDHAPDACLLVGNAALDVGKQPM